MSKIFWFNGDSACRVDVYCTELSLSNPSEILKDSISSYLLDVIQNLHEVSIMVSLKAA